MRLVRKHKTGPKETVRLYASGTIRLSEDLAISTEFVVRISDGVQQKLVWLVPADKCPAERDQQAKRKTWYSNRYARTPLLSIVTALDEMGINMKRAAGIYRATRTTDGVVRIEFSKKLRRAA